MTLDIVNAQNEKIGALEVRDEVFGGRVKADVVWQSVVRDNASRLAVFAMTRPGATPQQVLDTVLPEEAGLGPLVLDPGTYELQTLIVWGDLSKTAKGEFRLSP